MSVWTTTTSGDANGIEVIKSSLTLTPTLTSTPLPLSTLSSLSKQHQLQSESVANQCHHHNKSICDTIFYTNYKPNNHYNYKKPRRWNSNDNNGPRYLTNSLPGSLVNFLNYPPPLTSKSTSSNRYMKSASASASTSTSTKSNSQHNSPASSIFIPTTAHSNNNNNKNSGSNGTGSRNSGLHIGVAVGTTSAIASSILAHSINGNNHQPITINYQRQTSLTSQSQLLNYTPSNLIKVHCLNGLMCICSVNSFIT